MKKKVLFICTGNSCRSQMAEGLAKQMGWNAYSAGVNPSSVNPFAIKAMEEIDIDISRQISESVTKYTSVNFDLIVTVCDYAKATCPNFTGNFDKMIHRNFKDPFDATGTEEEILSAYRKSRDEIRKWLEELTRDNC